MPLPPILVAAYGNDMAGDDAFGPLAAEAVRAMRLPGVEVVSLGMRPASLLDHLAGCRAACVVDAARCEGLPAGTLIEVDFGPGTGSFFGPSGLKNVPVPLPTPLLVHDAALSTHGLARCRRTPPGRATWHLSAAGAAVCGHCRLGRSRPRAQRSGSATGAHRGRAHRRLARKVIEPT